MGTSNLTPEETPSQSRISSAPAQPAGRQMEEKHPMFDTLQVTKELRKSGFAEPQAEAVVVAFGAIAGNVATKDDLEDFAIKGDLERFATKGDLEKFATKDDLVRFATKDDLVRFATKDDLRALEAKMATKDDLKALEAKMATKDDLQHYATEANLLKAVGGLRQEMNAGFQNMQRFFIQAALGTVTVNIAMVAAIFVVAKYLF